MIRFLIYSGLLIIFLSLSQQGLGQGIQGAIALGGNLTQVDGDEVFGFKKIGINAAAIAIIPIQKKWSISLEASFSQKGAYQKYPNESFPNKELPYYNLRLNYAEVPVLVHFTDKEFLTVGLGMSWGRLVKVNEIEWGIKTPVDVYSGDFVRTDLNGIVDFRFPVYKKLNVNVRYAYSFAKIRTRTYTNLSGDEWTRNQYNNIITLRLYYIFNDRKPSHND